MLAETGDRGDGIAEKGRIITDFRQGQNSLHVKLKNLLQAILDDDTLIKMWKKRTAMGIGDLLAHNATVHLSLNGRGAVVGFRIVDPSGNEKIDRALKAALALLKVSETLPEGMPGGLTTRLSSQG